VAVAGLAVAAEGAVAEIVVAVVAAAANTKIQVTQKTQALGLRLFCF